MTGIREEKRRITWYGLELDPHGFPMIPDALCDGLLYVVVLCGTVGRLNTDLTMLVKNVLSSLTSYATVSIIGDSLVSVKKFADHPAFHSSTLFPHWKAFAALADGRRALFQTFNDTEQRRRKICDNVQPLQALFRVPNTTVLPNVRRQIGLRATMESSASLTAFRLSEMQHMGMPATPFFTLFKYIKGSVKIKVCPFSQLRVLWPNHIDGEGGLHNDLARAAHSRGCILVEAFHQCDR
ncbi:hypothetical protein B0H13DRAFT_1895460 [Mycena leptocephala]|nr:hypothetical protein B0H13DRAFT_1895460 [Mycena leptocephala]